MFIDINEIVSASIFGKLSFVAPKEHENVSCSHQGWLRTQHLGLDSLRDRSDPWPCISFGHPRMLWIPFCVGFQAASERLSFSRLWTWSALTLAPWLWWRPTALNLRKKLGITPNSIERMWVRPPFGALKWSYFCLLNVSWTLAGSGLMLSNSACIAGRDTSAQLSPDPWLPAAAFCRCGVDRWVERLWAALSREAVGTDVLCKEGKSWWCFKQAPRSPFHGLRWDAFRSKAKWTLRSSCYSEIIPNWKLNRSSAWYIFKISYQTCSFLLTALALNGIALERECTFALAWISTYCLKGGFYH